MSSIVPSQSAFASDHSSIASASSHPHTMAISALATTVRNG
jgi:hypothetical protein